MEEIGHRIHLENNSVNIPEPRALPSRKEKVGDDASPISTILDKRL